MYSSFTLLIHTYPAELFVSVYLQRWSNVLPNNYDNLLCTVASNSLLQHTLLGRILSLMYSVCSDTKTQYKFLKNIQLPLLHGGFTRMVKHTCRVSIFTQHKKIFSQIIRPVTPVTEDGYGSFLVELSEECDDENKECNSCISASLIQAFKQLQIPSFQIKSRLSNPF